MSLNGARAAPLSKWPCDCERRALGGGTAIANTPYQRRYGNIISSSIIVSKNILHGEKWPCALCAAQAYISIGARKPARGGIGLSINRARAA